jgi:ribosome-associated protein
LNTDSKPLAGRELVAAIVSCMVDNKADDIAAYDVAELTMMSDWYIICSGNAPVHARAIAQSVITGMKRAHTYPVHQEGVEGGRWAVIDFVDVVVHVMIPEIRDYYEIEELWSEGRRLSDNELELPETAV